MALAHTQKLLRLINDYVYQKELTLSDAPYPDFSYNAMKLIRAGADASIKATVGSRGSLLHYLVLEHEEKAIVDLLNAHPNLAQTLDANQCTPMQVLLNQVNECLNAFKKTALILINHANSLTAQATLGRKSTLLHYLISTNKNGINDQEIHFILKQHPALVDKLDGHQHTSLQMLMNQWIGDECSTEDFKHNAMILANAGASLHVKDSYFDATLLEHLSRTNYQDTHIKEIDILERLLQKNHFATRKESFTTFFSTKASRHHSPFFFQAEKARPPYLPENTPLPQIKGG